MPKKSYPVLTTAIGTAALVYVENPDDKAPGGASWKPDGKFKATLVVDNAADLQPIQDEALRLLREEFPDAPTDVDLLNLPVRAGEALGGKKAEKFAGKTVLEAKSQFRPSIYDGTGKLAPEGVYPRGGDVVRLKVSPYPFKKTEKVREKGKMVDVDVYGVSMRLVSVQIVAKRAGSSDGGFDAVEGGYEASPEDARPTRSTSTPSGGQQGRQPVTDGADF